MKVETAIAAMMFRAAALTAEAAEIPLLILGMCRLPPLAAAVLLRQI